jgi:hypothetical protein
MVNGRVFPKNFTEKRTSLDSKSKKTKSTANVHGKEASLHIETALQRSTRGETRDTWLKSAEL